VARTVGRLAARARTTDGEGCAVVEKCFPLGRRQGFPQRRGDAEKGSERRPSRGIRSRGNSDETHVDNSVPLLTLSSSSPRLRVSAVNSSVRPCSKLHRGQSLGRAHAKLKGFPISWISSKG
jgi:hypothetical protein